jgi:LysR family glycine cleavage system transcriptional activator
VLTAAALRVLPALERGFAGLLDAHAALLAADPQAPFRISVDTSFASVWLMPRLPELRRILAGRDVSIVPLDHALGDRVAVESDLAITYRSFPDGSGLLATRSLMTDRMVALIDAKTGASLVAPRSAETVARLPLIEVDPAMGDALYPRWPDWFAAAGLAMPDRAVQTRVGLSHLAMQVASEGLGVALVPKSVAEGSAPKLGLTEIGQDAEGLSLTRRLVWQREAPQVESIEAVVAALIAPTPS